MFNFFIIQLSLMTEKYSLQKEILPFQHFGDIVT
jgi:hypothetical protein